MLMPIRRIVRVWLEAETAIHPGSGESDTVQDMPVQTDVNGLPMICGTSLCGVLRHLYGADADALFGTSGKDENAKEGSRIFFSHAICLDENSKPVEGIRVSAFSPFLSALTRLPQRDHCRLDHKGVAWKNGKFDRTVLPAGIRFVFEFELIAENENADECCRVLELIHSPLFRVGGGTRNGFGKLKVIKALQSSYDIRNIQDRRRYLSRSSSLMTVPDDAELCPESSGRDLECCSWSVNLTSHSFWCFCAGNGHDDIDKAPKLESRIVWNGDHAEFDLQALIPATSIKGALAHRTAYYYNRLKGCFADKMSNKEFEAHCVERNEAVVALFGHAVNSDGGGKRGSVLLSDVYFAPAGKSWHKILNHVKIDRFTGGAYHGALFNEEVINGGSFSLNISVEKAAFNNAPLIKQAFESALNDLTEGRLPLGGGVMKGHGVFSGTIVERGLEK